MVSTELLITAIDVNYHLPPKNILLRSITRSIVNKRPKRGLETRPSQAFLLKTSRTTSSENFVYSFVFMFPKNPQNLNPGRRAGF